MNSVAHSSKIVGSSVIPGARNNGDVNKMARNKMVRSSHRKETDHNKTVGQEITDRMDHSDHRNKGASREGHNEGRSKIVGQGLTGRMDQRGVKGKQITTH